MTPSPWSVRGAERQEMRNYPLGGLSLGNVNPCSMMPRLGDGTNRSKRNSSLASLGLSCCVFLDRNLNTKLYTKSRSKYVLSHLLKFGHNHSKVSPAGGCSSFDQVSRNTRRAFKLAGDGLSFFDFIHGHGLQLGTSATPLITFGYLSLANICLTVVWRQESSGKS